jgi:hypothetical protein
MKNFQILFQTRVQDRSATNISRQGASSLPENGFILCFGFVAAYQSDFIFRKPFTMNNAFLLKVGFRF